MSNEIKLLCLSGVGALLVGCGGAATSVPPPNGATVSMAQVAPEYLMIGRTTAASGRAMQSTQSQSLSFTITIPMRTSSSGGKRPGQASPSPSPSPTPGGLTHNCGTHFCTGVQTGSSSRHLDYISPNTVSAVIAWTAGSATGTTYGSCPPSTTTTTSTCIVNISPLPPDGPVGFTGKITDGANGGGNLLAEGTATATLVAGTAQTVPIALDPAINEVDFYGTNAENTTPTQYLAVAASAASTVTVSAVVWDADGNVVPSSAAAVNYRDLNGAIVSFTGTSSLAAVSTSGSIATAGATLSGAYNGSAATGASGAIMPDVIGNTAGVGCVLLTTICETPLNLTFQ